MLTLNPLYELILDSGLGYMTFEQTRNKSDLKYYNLFFSDKVNWLGNVFMMI